MNTIKLLILVSIFSSCGVQKHLNGITDNYAIVIKTKKEAFTSKEHFDLFVYFINNTNEDIVVLNPKDEWFSMLHFFDSSINCKKMNEEFGVTPEQQKTFIRNENDLVTIKAKSSKEFKILGKYYDLICDSEQVSLKISYNSIKLPKWIGYSFSGKEYKQTKELYEKLSKLKVNSKEITIDLK